jgi:catechol 2,3-dioxygenase-like lactoylglutathione lyase family enzyme
MASAPAPSHPPVIADAGHGEIPSATSHVRLVRPTRDLAAAERFYVQGLGLKVLFRHSAPIAAADKQQGAGGAAHRGELKYDMLMLGFPRAAWHIELVWEPSGAARPKEAPRFPVPTPTEEDLLVLYLDGSVDAAVIENLAAAGGRRVKPLNPYWDRWGVMLEDPDGYRLVLSVRGWENEALEE